MPDVFNLFFTALEHSSSNTISRPLSGLLGFLSSLCTAWVFNYGQGAGVTAVGVVSRLSRPILARKLVFAASCLFPKSTYSFSVAQRDAEFGGADVGKGEQGLGWGKGQ